jgi:hypothetical protein
MVYKRKTPLALDEEFAMYFKGASDFEEVLEKRRRLE